MPGGKAPGLAAGMKYVAEYGGPQAGHGDAGPAAGDGAQRNREQSARLPRLPTRLPVYARNLFA